MRRIGLGLVLVAAVGLALALRLPELDRRYVHTDEAVHAYKLNELLTTGRYIYDPHEYHGPTLYYLTLPAVWLTGAADWRDLDAATCRIVPVVVGVGLIVLLVLVADGLGFTGAQTLPLPLPSREGGQRAPLACAQTLPQPLPEREGGQAGAAAVLTAVSPALVFYGRYYIQETLLVFFTFLMIGAGWRHACSRRVGWLVLAGVAAGCMHATKETCVLAWGAGLVALVGTWGWRRVRGGVEAASGRTPLWSPLGGGTVDKKRAAHGGTVGGEPSARGGTAKARVWVVVAVPLVVALATSAVLLSGFGANPRGALDAWLTFGTYLDRAGGGAHIHPWWFYLRTLLYTHHAPAPAWSEAFILLLGAVGAVAALASRRASGLSVFLALYTIVLTLAYAAIPYKTPWCLLGFLHGWVLLAGIGATVLVRWAGAGSGRLAVVLVVLVVGTVHLGVQAWRGATRFGNDVRNPYVYAHPVGDVLNLTHYVTRLAEVAEMSPVIYVIVENCWPLPWYLRSQPRVGYWEAVPAEVAADIVIASASFADELPAHLVGDYAPPCYYGLRRDETLVVYVRSGLRAAFERGAEGAR